MAEQNISAERAGTLKVGNFIVNRLGFGAMRITGQGIWGAPADPENAKRVLQRAVELNVNFIDTADAYGPEVSENLIRQALYPYEGLIIATKGGMLRGGPGNWFPDGSPEHLRAACEASLQRLGVEQITLYQFHRPDPKVPFTDSLKTLLELKNEGKIRHIGLSNVTLLQLKQALKLTPIASVQNHYNFEHRRDSEDVLNFCEQQGIAFIPYFPIGGGQSSYSQQTLQRVAQRHHVSAQQIALAWLLARSPVMLPIPGTSSIEHLEENVASANIVLDSDDLAALNTLSD
jgi:aryl-alcohol dehydrogenase-like predicted oxidoreductase